MKDIIFAKMKKLLKIRNRFLSAERLRKEEADFKKIYVGDDAHDAMTKEQCKNMFVAFLVLLIGLVFIIYYIANGNNGVMERLTEIERPEYGTEKVPVVVETEGGEEREFNLDVDVGSVKRSDTDALFEECRKYLEKVVLGENESADYVVKPLNFVNSVPSTDVTVEYEELDTTYIRYDGTLKNEDLEEPVIVEITMHLKYLEEEIFYRFPVVVCPPNLTENEKLLLGITSQVSKKDKDTRDSLALKLPESVNGIKLNWYTEHNSPIGIILLVLMIVAILPFAFWKDREKRLKERKEQMIKDYSVIINKFTLLLSAGMTVSGAFERICADYIDHDRERGRKYAYEEMLVARNEMKLGTSQVIAIENFGRRCDIKEYRKMCKIITSNLKHGSKSMLPLLAAEAGDSLAERRECVKRQGEEASTKLLFPMIMMLVIVMAIVMVPAFMSFSGVS